MSGNSDDNGGDGIRASSSISDSSSKLGSSRCSGCSGICPSGSNGSSCCINSSGNSSNGSSIINIAFSNSSANSISGSSDSNTSGGGSTYIFQYVNIKYIYV